MKFVVTPSPISDETLFDRIKDAANRSSQNQPESATSNISANVPLTSQTMATNNNNNTSSSALTDLSLATGLSSQHSASNNSISTVSTQEQQQQQISTNVKIENNPRTSQQVSISTTTIANNSTTFNAIESVPVSQVAIGPRHIALLLEDGRVCRTPFQVLAERVEFGSIPTNQSSAQISLSHHPGSNNNSGHNSSVAGNHPPNASQQHHSHHHHHHHHHHQQQQPPQNTSNIQVTTISKSSLSNVRLAGPPNHVSSSVIASGIMPTNLESRTSSSASLSGTGGSLGGSSGQGPGTNVPPSFAGRVSIPPQVGGLSVQNRQVARRGRMFRQANTRGRATSVIMGSRAGLIVSPQYVPEDLINQAQVVLQGKPRSAIVRELQRTNLDVNSAVNNLLSSDNEDPEDLDESQDYLPNEDLMSLLDSNVSLPSGPTSVLIDAETVFPEDVFNSYSNTRIRPTTIRHSVGSGSQSDRESSLASELEIRRMANRDASQSRRWLEHALRDPPHSDGSNSRMSSATPTDFTLHHKNESTHYGRKSNNSPELNPIHLSDTVELWPNQNDKKFVQIACMHSELIAITNNGQIHQWKWSESLPYEGIRYGDVTVHHPKVPQLNLCHEKVQLISASCIRATVVTESQKVATWIDDSIGMVAGKLEHGAQSFPEFQKGDRISQLHTCSLYSCVRLDSGAMFWWGVAPFSQRRKNWRKIQSKTCKHGPGGSSSAGDISVGSLVCLRNGPSFGDGAIGFTTKDGVPKVGRLVMSAWNITDTCTFKLIRTGDRRANPSIPQQIVSNDSKIQAHNPPTTTANSSIANATRARKMLGQPLDFSGNMQDDQPPSSPGISKNSSSERLEMPPPPSPASSTCSEPGCSPSHKRKKHLTSSKDDDKYKDEEQWNLKDVIFLEEVKKPPVAKVIKLDGNTALVRFNQRDPFGQQSDADVNAYLQDCRMIRKDELQLAKETTSSCRIIDFQRCPKRLNISDSPNFLTFTVSNNGIHALVMNGLRVEYKMYQLASGKMSKSLLFPTDTNALLGRDMSLITLHACGENDVTVTLRDGNGSLYPLSKDYLDSLREPQPLDMAPVQALGMSIHPLRDPNNLNRIVPTLIMAMALEKQILIPAVLRSDPEFVRLTLASLEKEPVSQQIVASEKIDLNRNILHAAVYSCAPTPTHGGSDKNRSYDNDNYEAHQSSSTSNYTKKPSYSDVTIKRHRGNVTAAKLRSSSQSNISSLSTTLNLSSDGETQSNPTFSETDSQPMCFETVGQEPSNSVLNRFEIDPTEQKQSAHLVLMILIESPVLKPYLKDLMIQKDANSMTPFMSAVSQRAYSAAMMLLDLAHWIVAKEENFDQLAQQRLLNQMIFPPGSHLDNNPLFMLCANDTCSFTWTGAAHITQDIFECRTCGLTRNLCCCTECARTCHKGHDCRLKNSSPTAYCDCWEKCKCKSLVSGSQQMRFRLFERLLTDTDLVTYPDSRGEMILLFLVQTVGRQMVEQRQYGHERSPRQSRRDDPDMPDHDMSPPRFARKALHKMLSEWLALKSVIMAGAGASQNLANASRNNSFLNAEEHLFLSSQQGTAILDRFTHSVLIKIGPEMLDVLLTTIIGESSSVIPSRVNEARLVAKRFVRSVARNGVVLSVELSPVNYSRPANIMDWFRERDPNSINSLTHHPWKLSPPPGSILQRCRKVFQALLPIAAEELAEIADALISPVRLGVPRPTAPFSLINSMAEATQASEEIFAVDPVVLPRTSSNSNPIESRPPNLQPTSVNQDLSQRGSSSLENRDPPVLSENPNASASAIRSILPESDIVMDTIDPDDAEVSNQTFRPSNNGESDSDSDSNQDDSSFQSNMDPVGTRSIATGATAGSEVGTSTVAYFSEADSGDSSNGDEDDDESETNDTEQDTDDLAFDEQFPFSRRSNANHSASQADPTLQSSRSSNLGQQLHWALRHRDHSIYGQSQSNTPFPSTAARLASIGLSSAYSYLDGAPARRSVITTNPQSSNAPSTNCEFSMYTTAVGLSRAFSIIIRSISDLIPILKESERSNSALTINQLRVSPLEAASIIANLEKKMTPVWEWLFKIMDSTEGQLRFGCALTNGIQAANQSTSSQHHQFRSSNFQVPVGGNSGHNMGASSSANFYGGQIAPNLLPVHPSMLARVNANLSAQNLNRRVPNLLEETATRVHQANSVLNQARGLDTGAQDAGVRLHNPISSQSSVPGRPQTLTRSNISSLRLIPEVNDGPNELARRDFLSYMISLIRSHGNEHHDSLPILDVSSLRHVAYVFDAYIYFLQSLNRVKISKQTDSSAGDYDESSSPLTATPGRGGARHPFFRRSESTLFLDEIVPDPFSAPISETLPLAEQPHLLQPHARREDLFGIAKKSDVSLESIPLQLSLTASNSSCPKCNTIPKQAAPMQVTTMIHSSTSSPSLSTIENKDSVTFCALHKLTPEQKSKTEEWRHTALLSRWRLTVELFGREFLDDVGAEPGSILIELVGFPLKENRFRKEMERLRNDSAPKEISFVNIERDQYILIRQTIKQLNSTFNNIERSQTRRNHDLPILTCSKVKVSFKDEKGEGNGVARSFYTAFCEAVLSNETFSLFYQPGIRNFYSPCQGDASPDRLNAFCNVGRVIGICLLQNEICPIQFNRHVIKYLLRRPIAWHDLAFFDPVLYESLRQLIVDAEQNHQDGTQSTLSSLDLRFCVDLCEEEGGGQTMLAPGGEFIEVTPINVYEYVRRYALKRMLKSQEKALESMRRGVMDVLPANALDNLTAEDFRLLLNGVGEINVQTLVSYTTFIDDRGTSAGKRTSIQIDEQLGYFKKWFWSIVEKMTTKERQDLVYFWTGSPALPASDEGFQPMPTVSIRPAEDLHLPTSNVCIFRLYIPLYSSKAILRNKLLIAIKEKNFGFI